MTPAGTTRSAAVLVSLVSTAAILSAVQVTLDTRAVGDAIAIGQSRSEKDQTAYHAPYVKRVGRAPVDFLEVVTPFRRVVLHAQSRARVGDRSFNQRQAFAVLDDASAQIDVWVELTFHPHNTYVGVPAYEVSLVDTGGRAVPAKAVERVPRFGARVDGEPLRLPVPGGIAAPGLSQPMLGGTVMAQFDGGLVNPAGRYDVVVREEGKEIARVRVDLERLR